MDGSVLEEKTIFKMLGLSFSCKLDWGCYLVSTAKKLLDSFYKVFSSEAAFYLYEYIIPLCMEYCCHVWADASGCYVDVLDKLQKRVFRIVGPSLAASLEHLVHRRNMAS